MKIKKNWRNYVNRELIELVKRLGGSMLAYHVGEPRFLLLEIVFW